MKLVKAIARLAGVGGRRGPHAGARILMVHGTSRRQAGELRRQLAYLKRGFRILPLEAFAGGKPAPDALALTFDDGLRNNVTVAYPILKALDLPATFFVCPGLIEARAWLWNHEARQRLRWLGRAEREVEATIGWMKTLDLAARQEAERRLREMTAGFAPSAAQREAFDLAGWDELAALDPALVTVGSHTLSHPILTTLTRPQAQAEIRDSRELIERRLGRPAELFCYPNGDVDPVAREAVRRHYRAAVTTQRGSVGPGCDRFRLPRWAAPRGLLRLAARIAP
jgi:peptidoglycan/xylan/chitin deacetylase (PgdA/CDA1 family)